MAKKQEKPHTEIDHFVALNMRAFIEAKDPYEFGVVLALVFWHWWKSDKSPSLGVAGVATLGRMSPSQAKRVLARLKKRGWVETTERSGQKTSYRLTVRQMRSQEAFKIATAWLSQIRVDDPQLDLWGPTPSSDRADTQLPQLPSYIIGDSRKDSSKDSDRTAVEGAAEAAANAEEEIQFWKSAQGIFSTHTHGQLEWPRLKGFKKKYQEAVKILGAAELARRWENMVLDPFTRPSLMKLCSEPDAWINRREKNTGHAGRQFNQANTGEGWAPSGK